MSNGGEWYHGKGFRVYVVTAWNEDTGEDIVKVYTDKDRAVEVWSKIQDGAFALGQTVYGGVYRRKTL